MSKVCHRCFYTTFFSSLVFYRLCWKGKMVAAAGHLFRRWFSQLLQPLLCKMNPGGHCFCQSTEREGLEQWMSINDCLTDSCLNAAINAYLAAYWLISRIIVLQHLRICEVAMSLFTPYDLWSLCWHAVEAKGVQKQAIRIVFTFRYLRS